MQLTSLIFLEPFVSINLYIFKEHGIQKLVWKASFQEKRLNKSLKIESFCNITRPLNWNQQQINVNQFKTENFIFVLVFKLVSALFTMTEENLHLAQTQLICVLGQRFVYLHILERYLRKENNWKGLCSIVAFVYKVDATGTSEL